MMIIDMTIVACSFLLPFDGDIDARIQARVETIVYGLAAIAVYSGVANYIVNADKQTIQFLILSPKWNEIADNITHRSGRGVTTFDGHGYWTGEDRTMSSYGVASTTPNASTTSCAKSTPTPISSSQKPAVSTATALTPCA